MTRKRHMRMGDAYPTIVEDGKKLCCYCRKPLEGRNRRYCSDDCMEKVWRRCSPGRAAHWIQIDRKGVCERCGLDCRALDHALRQLRTAIAVATLREHDWRPIRELLSAVLSAMRHRGWHCSPNGLYPCWESLTAVHHIVPHAQGGTLEPNNLILLCVPCHKAVHRGAAVKSAEAK